MPDTDTSPPLDIDAVRADFPILSRQVHGKPLVYLDNAASAQKPQVVIDAMTRSMEEEYSNVHRGLHFLSNLATERYEAARGAMARFLNAADEREIIFTLNATDAINIVASSYGEDHIGEGDEIILSQMEHHSNIVPWHFFRGRRGAVIKWAPVDEDGAFLFDEFVKLITPRTKMIALTHMSNVLGTVVPIADVVKVAHQHGIPVLVDGSQGAVHLPVDVQALGCDFYVCTGHKLYGPSGIGVLYGRFDRLSAMRPYRGGGEMIREVHFDAVTYGEPPTKFEAGTPQITEAAALHAAIDYMTGLGREAIAAHEHALMVYAMEQLEALDGVRILGRQADKGSICTFVIEGAHAHDISTIIDRSGVAVRAGHHCCQPLMERYGVNASVRASFGVYNTHDEVDAFIKALEKAKDMLS
ncbi:MAG: cysteine desulfurase [Alphaproteobacteria bacterium]